LIKLKKPAVFIAVNDLGIASAKLFYYSTVWRTPYLFKFAEVP
jgi:hypothetical protein